MKLYLRLLSFIKPHKSILFLSIFFLVFAALFDSASLSVLVPLSDNVLGQHQIVINRELPAFLTHLINRINQVPALTMLYFVSITMLILFLFKSIFIFCRTYFVTKLSQLVVRDIRNALYRKVQAFSLDYFTETAIGSLVSRITYDVQIIKGTISVGLTDMVYQLLMFIFLNIIVFYINWKGALLVICILTIVVYPVIRVGKMIKKISTQVQNKMAGLNNRLFETISGIKIVKAFSQENAEIKKVAEQNFSFYKSIMKMQKRVIALGPFVEMIGACGGILVLFFGGQEVISGRMSLGVFIFFMSALMSLIRPCRRLSEVHSINQQGLAAAKRIFEILDAPIKVMEKKDAIELPLLKKNICFENINFAYKDKLVIKDLNLEIKKGEAIALVGASGSGKTTLVNLVARFYDPTKGAIKIDGFNLKDIQIKSLRQQIGIVSQDLFLFNDSVRNNIAYSRQDADISEVINAAKIALADEFIRNLPQGYDTYIGDMGMKLSGGQKQRLSIARAVLNNPPILILDEATSQLDAESTMIVQKALDTLMINRTAIVIAHRLSTVKKANKIIVLDKGRIVETGTHNQLLKAAGIYKKLFDLEFMV
ncbi:MAG: hypothetical protein DRP78_02815 [Candidatus Omnitrophota bacterium]|nr:MAG: hypothetical protein DRP78_02815 [Candidatus Omnitrophota bacterium]